MMLRRSLLGLSSGKGQLGLRSFCASRSGPSGDGLIKIRKGCNGITHLVLNRHEGRNSLSKAMLAEFNDAVKDIGADPKTNVLIISSAVPKVFCAGADLKERALMPEDQIENFVEGLRNSFTAVEALPMPTIAAIDGAALGGGLELALACDIRVASDISTIGLPETALAIIPGAGGTQRLPRLLGVAKAKELIFLARRMDGMEAKAIGLITECTNQGAVMEKAEELAVAMNACGPLALRMAKKAIHVGMQADINAGLDVEKACYAQVIPTEDRTEGLAAFKERRKPVYKGR